MGAPIIDADSAAIPAKTRESPKVSIPKILPKRVNIPPSAAPKTNAGENTPPKKPRPRQATVTASLRERIINKKKTE